MNRLFLLLLLLPLAACQRKQREHVRSGPADSSFTVEITNPGFRLAIRGGERVILPPHKKSGLSFLGSPARESKKIAEENGRTTYRLTNADGKTATVVVEPRRHMLLVRVKLDNDQHGEIGIHAQSPGASFGLGDHGSYGESANLSLEQKTYPLKHDGGIYRWISSFLVFPERGVAGAFFDRGGGRVAIGPKTWTMARAHAKEQTFYFFTGSMPEIYAAWAGARTEEGYPGVEPKARAFDLGWESWDPLRWKTNARSVRDELSTFRQNGYPIQWAVTGSGFWKPGGSSVHFGEWNEENYSSRDRASLRRFMSDHQIHWLIGQRTSFVVPGGPHPSKAGQSGATRFDTSPLTETAVAKELLLEDADGSPVTRVSPYYPTVPCHVLDGRQPIAAQFFEHHFRRWEADGVKEDTMLDLPDHSIFNGPMRALAEAGNLVIARSGSYSSPGTLTRINDTHGPSEMTLRSPINFLQYAASGAPNVYADSVGMAHMKDPQASLRHAWLCALTAGMSLGVGPWEWSPEHRRIYEKAAHFHDALSPYLHSQAIASFRSGYPHTLTPLPIAYPGDRQTYNLASKERRQFQWLIGPSLLAAPLLHDRYRSTDKMTLYLPAGVWIDYESGQRFEGPTTLRDFSMPLAKIPLFVGGKGVLVLRERKARTMTAFVYPIAGRGSVYRHYYRDPAFTLTVVNHNDGWNPDSLKVTESDPGESRQIDFQVHSRTGAISFPVRPGREYELTGGK